MRTSIFYYLFLNLLILWILAAPLSGQSALEIVYGAGYTVPNSPKFPKIQTPSYNLELSWHQYSKHKNTFWAYFYKRPIFSVAMSAQTTGNSAILGTALAAIPTMSFFLLRQKRWECTMRLGWGIGYLTKRYDSFQNPHNQAIGSHWNAYAMARLGIDYRISRHFQANFAIGVAHYSCAGTAAPNLGINIPSAMVGFNYIFANDTISKGNWNEKLASLPKLHRFIFPFVQVSLGMTGKDARGPKFPVYVATIGVSRLLSRISKLSAGFEYIYNTATYELYQHILATPANPRQIERFCFFVQHELLFGHIGFVTAGGIYLNKHLDQRSIISTKMGLNFYLQNYFRRLRHKVWSGIHIRAYFGEAEFLEWTLGYQF